MKKVMKKSALTALMLTAFATFTPAFAQVKLVVDEHIKVTAINGQEIKHGLLQPLQREFTLKNGKHVITARYDRLFDLNREHDYVKSGNVTVTATLADGEFELVMPNQPTSYQSAKEYAKNPSLAIAQNGKIIAQENVSEERTGILSGVGVNLGGIFNRNNDALNANQKVIASLDTGTATPATPVASQNSDKPAKADDNLDDFMKIWLNSSEAERDKIRQWIQK